MNKLFGLFLLAVAFLAPVGAQAATCFWVGGTGSINDVTHWSSSSGGAGSTCASAGGWPNGGFEIANLDANSGGGTITRNVNWTIGTLNISAFTGTFGNSGDTASVDVSTFTNSGSGTRTVNLGAGIWTVSTTWGFTGATNLTLNANTSIVRTVGGLSTGTNMLLGTFTYNVVTLQANLVGGSVGMNTGNPTIGTFNIQAPNYIYVNNGNNITVTGSLNFSGGGFNAWTGFATTAPNNNFTFTLSGGPTTCNYCSFRDTTAVTNAITATNSIDYGHNTNVTPITPPSGGGSCPGRIIGGENKFQTPIPSRGQLASVC